MLCAVLPCLWQQGKMTDAELADKICLEVTKVCKGVDLEAETAKQMSPGGQTVGPVTSVLCDMCSCVIGTVSSGGSSPAPLGASSTLRWFRRAVKGSGLTPPILRPANVPALRHYFEWLDVGADCLPCPRRSHQPALVIWARK